MNMTNSSWSAAELGGAEFGDRRLNARLLTLCDAFAASPASSLPTACGSPAATKAAYRYFGNARVSAAAILAPHLRRSAERVEALEPPIGATLRCVLVAQDTTSLLYGKQGVRDLGYLETAGRRGIFLHTALAISTEGDVLGHLAQRQWVRDDQSYGKKADRKSTPSHQKESDVWRQIRDEARQVLPESVQMISLMDREADIFTLLAAPRAPHTDYIIRVAQKRRTVRSVAATAEAGDVLLTRGALIDRLEATDPIIASMSVEIGRAAERPARTATLSVRQLEVEIPAPPSRSSDTPLPPVTVRVLLVREDHPPLGQTAIEWVLVTTLALASIDEAMLCVENYSKRWLIERFHYTLKSGLQIEELQLESRASLSTAIALLSVVAWHLMHLLYHARVHPDASCEPSLEPAQWKALVLRQQRGCHVALPSAPPSMKQAMLWIAQLGGYRGRTTDIPGIKTLWRGLRRLADMTETYHDMDRLMTASAP
jgi:hypothetical protein